MDTATAELIYDVLIVGGGPAGLEFAAAARERGLNCLLLERGRIGEHVLRWGFVRMFTPWSWNVGAAGPALSHFEGDPNPTGAEFVERYLQPLARSLGDCVVESMAVLAIAREGLLKHEAIGDPRRAERPFVVIGRDTGGREHRFRARHLVDASGVFGQARWMGDGGIAAQGEDAARTRIAYRVEPLPELLEGRYAVVGAGYSAATMLDQLVSREVPADWLIRDRALAPIPDDPLPERRRLAELCERIATGRQAGIDLHAETSIRACQLRPDGLQLLAGDGRRLGPYARVFAMVGYRPDLSILRELHFHSCYATEGPMKLASALLGAGAGGDCLAIGEVEADALRNPEPGLFVIGAKSYGRNGDFLLQRLAGQIDAVLDMIA